MRKKSVLIFMLILMSVSFAYAQTPLVPDGAGGYIDPETGTQYSSDGIGGVVNSRDGTYLSPTGANSGFINSRDGRFIPAVPDPNRNNNNNNDDDDDNNLNQNSNYYDSDYYEND